MAAACRSYASWRVDFSKTKDLKAYFDVEFIAALKEIDMKSTPGCCQLRTLGPRNADIFCYKDGEMDPDRVALVKELVWTRLNALLDGANVSDNISVFVKPEPHKFGKIKEGRLRLISAVSLIDTLVDRVLFGWLQRKALTVVGETPCLCGWTPLLGGWRYLSQEFRNTPVMCLDKSSWDWTVQAYMVEMWKLFIKSMAVGHHSWWSYAVDKRFEQLFDKAVFEFSDGTTVDQGGVGIMKSGCFLTLLLNSVSQSILHYLAYIRMGENPMKDQPRCVGDDTVQRSVESLERYVDEMSSLGAKVKGFKVQNWVEFCGFAITGDSCFPAYWQKHLFKLQFGELKDSLASYQMIYANEPLMFEFLQRVALEVDPKLALSSFEAKQIMNG